MREEVLVLEERGIDFLGLDSVGTDAADVILVVREPAPQALPDQRLRLGGEADLFIAVEGNPLAAQSRPRQETGQCTPERLLGAAQALGHLDGVVVGGPTESTFGFG